MIHDPIPNGISIGEGVLYLDAYIKAFVKQCRMQNQGLMQAFCPSSLVECLLHLNEMDKWC